MKTGWRYLYGEMFLISGSRRPGHGRRAHMAVPPLTRSPAAGLTAILLHRLRSLRGPKKASPRDPAVEDFHVSFGGTRPAGRREALRRRKRRSRGLVARRGVLGRQRHVNSTATSVVGGRPGDHGVLRLLTTSPACWHSPQRRWTLECDAGLQRARWAVLPWKRPHRDRGAVPGTFREVSCSVPPRRRRLPSVWL